MRKTLSLLGIALLAGASAPVLAQEGSQADAQRAAQAGRDAQLAIEAHTPQLAVTEEILPLRIPGHTIGETEGVAKNKAGHLFVYSRTGFGGSSRGGGAARLFEFDQKLKYVKEWLPDFMAPPSPMPCAWIRSRMSGWWMKAPTRCRRSIPPAW